MGTLTNSTQRATKLADQIITDALTFYVSSGGQRKELSQQIQALARAVAMQLVDASDANEIAQAIGAQLYY